MPVIAATRVALEVFDSLERVPLAPPIDLESVERVSIVAPIVDRRQRRAAVKVQEARRRVKAAVVVVVVVVAMVGVSVADVRVDEEVVVVEAGAPAPVSRALDDAADAMFDRPTDPHTLDEAKYDAKRVKLWPTTSR